MLKPPLMLNTKMSIRDALPLSKKIFFLALTQFIGMGFSQPAAAGLGTSIMQTAPVIAPETYEIKLQNDIIFSDGGGVTISPHLRTGLVEHFLDLDVFFGTGKRGFQVGGLVKYNLLPDLQEQMGLSFLGGLSYIKDEGLSYGLLSFGILTSKELQTDFGTIAPYAALQPEVLFRSDLGTFAIGLAAGAFWKVTDTSPWSFYSEFGISLKDSLFYLGLGVSHPF